MTIFRIFYTMIHEVKGMNESFLTNIYNYILSAAL